MESQRIFLFIGLLLVSFLLYQNWNNDYGPQPVQQQSSTVGAVDDNSGLGEAIPHGPDANASTDTGLSTSTSGKKVTVTTDKLRVVIDTHGGDLVKAELLDFPIEKDNDNVVKLFHKNGNFIYKAQSGLIGPQGIDGKQRANYQVAQDSYTLQGDTLDVPLTYRGKDGITVVKHFRFSKNSYVVDVVYDITNGSDSVAKMQDSNGLQESVAGEEGSMLMPTYRGPAYSTADTRYQKYKFTDMEGSDGALFEQTKGGWVAMLQHYFVTAWVPDPNTQYVLATNSFSENQPEDSRIANIRTIGPMRSIAPGQQVTISNKLFVGPKDQKRLSALSPTLNLVVDYGFLWWLAQPIHWLLTLIHGLVINWGLTIIILTLLVKTVLYPLTKKQYESMAKMRILQPKIATLRERYGDDKQKLQQEMMGLYRKEGANPLGGCLPILLQMPIFIALYWVLMESVELRHAEFFGWISDLSVKDPYYILPLLMGASMFLMQKLSPTTVADPTQQKIMMFMPVIMTFVFLNFPAGLVLYWLVSNLVTIAQQWLINKAIEKKAAAKGKPA